MFFNQRINTLVVGGYFILVKLFYQEYISKVLTAGEAELWVMEAFKGMTKNTR